MDDGSEAASERPSSGSRPPSGRRPGSTRRPGSARSDDSVGSVNRTDNITTRKVVVYFVGFFYRLYRNSLILYGQTLPLPVGN